MSLIKLNEINGLPVFPEFFGKLFNADVSDYVNHLEGSIPFVNISETNDDFRIELTVPGLEKEDLEIKVEKGKLIISGKNNHKEEDSGVKYIKKEFNYKTFTKTFHLPELIDLNKIEASCKNGVLAIVLGKKEEVKKINQTRIVSIS